MGKIYDCVTKNLEGMDIKFEKFEDDEVIAIPNIGGNNGSWNCIISVQNDTKVIIASICDVKTKRDRRKEVMEYITRVNHEIAIGKWDIDLDGEGSVTYKTSLYLDESLDEKTIEMLLAPVFMTNIYTYDRYLPGLMGVIFGYLAPREAIEKIEEQRKMSETELEEHVKEELDELVKGFLNARE